jgi:large subunit ribosomal protein L15
MTFKINSIKRPAGYRKKGKRLGRGIGSGKGKTSGRGHKGAKSRSGGAKYNPGFEGGQMPLIMRIPKRGFTNIFKKEWNIVNTGVLQELASVKEGASVDKAFLLEAGIIRKKRLPLKVLAKGEMKKAITVKADAFSEAAKKAIEGAGGKAEKA